MKAMLYMASREEPVAVLDEVKLVEYNDNHKEAPTRIFFTSARFNAGKTMLELHRDEKLIIKMDDGRAGPVLLQHSSLDMEGRAVGVLRTVGPLAG